MKEYTIYTDGSCLKNPGGPGGWAYIVLADNFKVTRNSGSVESTTNNRMEIMAAINGLLSVPEGGEVTVFSDSQYLVNGASSWWHRWQKRGWKIGGRPVKNADLWQLLVEVMQARKCRFKWVRGHHGNRWNEECDQMANEAAGLADLVVAQEVVEATADWFLGEAI